jgi:hypothetical protein
MSDSNVEIKPVFLTDYVFEESIKPPPRARWWHWVRYWFYNWKRKPLLALRQKELEALRISVLKSLDTEVLQKLMRLRHCDQCVQCFTVLKPIGLLSTLEMAIKTQRCYEHPSIIQNFQLAHGLELDKARRLAAWICGFETPK